MILYPAVAPEQPRRGSPASRGAHLPTGQVRPCHRQQTATAATAAAQRYRKVLR